MVGGFNIPSIMLRLVGDASGLRSELNKARADVKGFRNDVDDSASSLGRLSTLGRGLALGFGIGLGIQAIGMGVNLLIDQLKQAVDSFSDVSDKVKNLKSHSITAFDTIIEDNKIVNSGLASMKALLADMPDFWGGFDIGVENLEALKDKLALVTLGADELKATLEKVRAIANISPNSVKMSMEGLTAKQELSATQDKEKELRGFKTGVIGRDITPEEANKQTMLNEKELHQNLILQKNLKEIIAAEESKQNQLDLQDQMNIKSGLTQQIAKDMLPDLQNTYDLMVKQRDVLAESAKYAGIISFFSGPATEFYTGLFKGISLNIDIDGRALQRSQSQRQAAKSSTKGVTSE